jgi:zinc and cadmium transporter
MMGLLPESLNELPAAQVFGTLLGGIMLFFVLEKLVLWRHCHTHDCEVHESSVASVMIGDTFHNFVDGAVIGAAVLTSIPLGVSTAIAVAAHEIPQEIGDFAILLHAGYSRERALLLNVLSALASVAGAMGTFLAFDLRAANAAILPGDRRVELPVCSDGRPDPWPSPRSHRCQLTSSDCPDCPRDLHDGLVLLKRRTN